MADPECNEWSFRSDQSQSADDQRVFELGGGFAQLSGKLQAYLPRYPGQSTPAVQAKEPQG